MAYSVLLKKSVKPVLILAILVPSIAIGAPRILKSESRQASVELNRKSVVVELTPADPDNPPGVSLTIRDAGDKPYTVELKALPSGSTRTGGEFSKYSGRLPKPLYTDGIGGFHGTQQNFVGIELSVRLPGGKSDVLREKTD